MNALARRNPTDKYPGYHGITKITILFRRKINQIPRYGPVCCYNSTNWIVSQL